MSTPHQGQFVENKTKNPVSDAPLIVVEGSELDTLAKPKPAEEVLYANDSFSVERKK